MKKFTFFTFMLLALWNVLEAQVSIGGKPVSYNYEEKSVLEPLTFVQTPPLDMAVVEAEDAQWEAERAAGMIKIGRRFGIEFTVDYDIHNSGTWTCLPDGGRLWRLGVECPEALSINLIFDQYRLPYGATLYIFSEDKHDKIGGFTDYNNQADNFFATDVVLSDKIVIEYYQPADADFDGELRLATIVHGYRGPGDLAKSFGQSGACQRNTICPEGVGWEDQIRSVVAIYAGGTELCSGAVINNTANDGTPYILTANHCYQGTSPGPGSWVFRFNWESPTCTPTTNSSYQTMTGSQVRVRTATSTSSTDCCLLELNQPIPSNYNAYFAGWSRSTTAPPSGIIIHHPTLDIKKITPSSDIYSVTQYVQGWRANFTVGGPCTEGGSSGSPLFDNNHRIIGQEYGGLSYCGASAPNMFDVWGKFNVSWDATPLTSAGFVKDYLDPQNLNPTTWDGYDPNGATSYTINASVNGGNGTISPSGAVSVPEGTNKTFTFQPNANYEIAQVLVDNVNDPGAVSSGSYTFVNVTANHTIVVSFSAISSVCNPPTNLTSEYASDCSSITLTWDAPNRRGVGSEVYFGHVGGTSAVPGRVMKGTVGNPFPGTTVNSNNSSNQQCYEYINGELYCVRYVSGGNSIGKINMTTGDFTNIASINCDGVSLCYNPVDGLTYVFPWSGTDSESSNWGTVNITNGTFTIKGTYPKDNDHSYFAAIDNNGVCYAVRNMSTEFGTINLSTGVFTPTATLPYTLAYIQNMSFDRETNELYWMAAANDFDGSRYFKINTSTGALSQLGSSTTQYKVFTTITEVPVVNRTYNIYRDDVKIGTTTDNFYIDNNFNATTAPKWCVKQVCGSEESDPICVTPGICDDTCEATITPSAGEGGTITPNVPVTINCGESQKFTFAPNNGYKIAMVLIDDVNNPAAVVAGEYTFVNVTEDHTISVSFIENEAITYIIKATADENGEIAPEGEIVVIEGENQKFTFAPNDGYKISMVLVDDVNNPAAVATGEYTFVNVTENHTISVCFIENEAITHIITATTDENGEIAPEGEIVVVEGKNQKFIFTPNDGCKIETVLIDNVNNPDAVAAGEYTFVNVTENHTIAVTFDCETSIEKIEMQSIKIYPNPTNGQLTIENGQLTIEKIEIFDMMGKIVFQLSTLNSQLSTQMDVSHLPAGAYFIRLQTENGQITKQITIIP